MINECSITIYHGIKSGKFKLLVEKEGFRTEIIIGYNEIMQIENSINTCKKLINIGSDINE